MGRPPVRSVVVATQSRLLDAALGEFAARGLAGARLADIAAAAGITRPSLLYHYPTKELLHAATLERSFASLARMVLGSIHRNGDFRTRLRALVDGFVGFATSEPDVCRLLLRTIVADDDPAAREQLVHRAAPLLADVARFLVEDGRDDVRAGLPVRGMLMGVIVDVLSRAAAGPALRAGLWGDDDGFAGAWHVVEHAILAAQPAPASLAPGAATSASVPSALPTSSSVVPSLSSTSPSQESP